MVQSQRVWNVKYHDTVLSVYSSSKCHRLQITRPWFSFKLVHWKVQIHQWSSINNCISRFTDVNFWIRASSYHTHISTPTPLIQFCLERPSWRNWTGCTTTILFNYIPENQSGRSILKHICCQSKRILTELEHKWVHCLKSPMNLNFFLWISDFSLKFLVFWRKFRVYKF